MGTTFSAPADACVVVGGPETSAETRSIGGKSMTVGCLPACLSPTSSGSKRGLYKETPAREPKLTASGSSSSRSSPPVVSFEASRPLLGSATGPPPVQQPAAGGILKQTGARGKGTRARRLSFVVSEKSAAAEKIREEYGKYNKEAFDEQAALGTADASAVINATVPPTAEQLAMLRARHAAAAAARRPTVACLSCAGREPGYAKSNQDSCFAFERYAADGSSLFGTMDGHGPAGHLVSLFLKSHLPLILLGPLSGGEAPDRALETAFLEADARLAASGIDVRFSGSTAVVAHLDGVRLTVAWAGDSRAVLGRVGRRGGWEGVELTSDHKPTNHGEKERILGAQGRVARMVDSNGQPVGPHRVWLPSAWLPGLAMSRALGDQVAHQVGVSTQPDIVTRDLGPADRLLILGSDGLWEFMTAGEAVDIAARCGSDVSAACRELVYEAQARWMAEEDGVVDDITAVVVRLPTVKESP